MQFVMYMLDMVENKDEGGGVWGQKIAGQVDSEVNFSFSYTLDYFYIISYQLHI